MNYKLRELTSHQAQVLEPGDCRVGREEIMDLVIPGGSVSRHHANLHNSPEGVVWVIDLGSTNGTTVDGTPAKDWLQVQPGQTIRFGDVDIRLENETEAEQVSSPSPKTPAQVAVTKEGKPKSVPAELGPNPTASGHLPKDLPQEQGNSAASPKNLLAVKPKKASGIVLPPRSALSAQIAPPDLPQQKIVSAEGVLANGEQSSAGETLQLPSKEVLDAHRQVNSLVKRANAIAQSTPPERNTGEILETINQEEEIKAAEKNRQTDSFKLPPLDSEANGHGAAPVQRNRPEHDTSMEPLRMAAAPVVAPVQGTPKPGAFVHPEPRQSAQIQPARAAAPQPVAATPAPAAGLPKAQVQPSPEEDESDVIVQPMSPMARMSRDAVQNGPVLVPAQSITAANAAPAPQSTSPMVKASEVAYYKSLAFLGVGLFVGFVLGVVVCKYFL